MAGFPLEDYPAIFEEYVEWIVKCMNPEADPAEDFYEYACGKYESVEYDNKIGEFTPGILLDVYAETLVNERINGSLIRKVRDFNRSIDLNPKSILQNEELRAFCGGFPVFDETWTEAHFDMIKAAGVLSLIGCNTLLSCQISFTEDKKIMCLSPANITSEELENAEDALKLIQISPETIAIIKENLYTIKEKMDAISVRSNQSEAGNAIKSIEELSTSIFNYRSFFEAMGYMIDFDDVLCFPNESPDYVEEFLKIFFGTPTKTVANFFVYRIACIKDKHMNRFELVRQHFESAIFAVAFSWYFTPSDEKNRAEFFERLKNNFKKELPLSIENYTDTFDEKISVLNYLRFNFKYENVTDEYATLHIEADNFLGNIINLGKHGIPRSLKKCMPYSQTEKDMYHEARSLLRSLVALHNKPMLHFCAEPEIELWRKIFDDIEKVEYIENFDFLSENLKIQLHETGQTFEDLDIDEFYVNLYLSIIAALQMAFRNYVSWHATNEPLSQIQDGVLKKYGLNSMKFFFIKFAHAFYYDDSYPRPMTAKMALWNSEDFAREFRIAPTSEMSVKKGERCFVKWKKS